MSEIAHKSRLGSVLLIGGGLATAGAALLAWRRSSATVAAIREQVDAPAVALPPSPQVVAKLPIFRARLTGYWPFTARADEKKMEGGIFDRKMPAAYKDKPQSQQYKDHLLRTVEQFLAGQAEFVSVSGDDSVWPYGQKILIPWVDGRTIVGRVVDTGSHFRGVGKLYRVVGAEPLDVCVQSSETVVPKLVDVKVVPGDHWAKTGLQDVAASGLRDQQVRFTGDVVEGRTLDDHEALARMVESEAGSRSRDEQLAAAWAARNRADFLGTSVCDLLCPKRVWGSAQQSGGYASTRRVPSTAAREVAEEVLGADSGADVSSGAIDFWVPEEQNRLRALGDVHRAAKSSGNEAMAKRYERYARYGTEGDVRSRHARAGLRVVGIVGGVELLGRLP